MNNPGVGLPDREEMLRVIRLYSDITVEPESPANIYFWLFDKLWQECGMEM